ncbi:MAG: hypothetical protein DRJ03_13525 [Chloroflexi bacterium]|nr:MAG: hypothetical protein DRJ03_13525 [Chloroflexota bacterium]
MIRSRCAYFRDFQCCAIIAARLVLGKAVFRQQFPLWVKSQVIAANFAIAQGALRGKIHAIWKSRLQNGNCWCSGNYPDQRKFERFRLSALVPEGGVGESTVF